MSGVYSETATSERRTGGSHRAMAPSGDSWLSFDRAAACRGHRLPACRRFRRFRGLLPSWPPLLTPTSLPYAARERTASPLPLSPQARRHRQDHYRHSGDRVCVVSSCHAGRKKRHTNPAPGILASPGSVCPDGIGFPCVVHTVSQEKLCSTHNLCNNLDLWPRITTNVFDCDLQECNTAANFVNCIGTTRVHARVHSCMQAS